MVEIRTVSESATAVVAWTTTWPAFRNEWQPALDEVWAVLRATGLRPGHNVMLYHDDLPTVEVGVQVMRAFDPIGRVRPSVLPAARAACHVHRGPYSALDHAHVSVRKWCAQNGYGVTGRRWEIYGDWSDDPEQLETAIYWQLV